MQPLPSEAHKEKRRVDALGLFKATRAARSQAPQAEPSAPHPQPGTSAPGSHTPTAAQHIQVASVGAADEASSALCYQSIASI